MQHKSRTQAEHHERVNKILGKAENTKVHPDAREDAAMIRKAVRAHETALHPGQPHTKLAAGGRAKKSETNVIINVGGQDQAAAQAEKQQAAQQGLMMGAKMAAAKMAGPAMAPPAGMPPGGPGMPPGPRPPMPPGAGGPPGAPPPPGMKRGGSVR